MIGAQRHPEPPSDPRGVPADDGPVRVILVGRTGFDLPLRMDRAIELVRASTLTAAIGELGNAVDRSPTSSRCVTILVGRDALPASPADATRFRDAVRLVEPEARIYRVDPAGAEAAAPPEGFDGAVSASLAQLEIRRFVRAVHTAPPPSAAPQTCDPGPSTPPAPTPRDDLEPIIDALLHGHDPLPAAVAALRRATGDPNLAFVAPGDPDAAAPDLVPVTHRARTLGWLRASPAACASLEPAARELALWLALREQHEQLRTSAFTDDLTGAWNRRYFERFLKAAIESAAAARRSVTLLFFDLDNLKQYNDQFGHAAGDNILRETVRLLKSVIRPTDRVCRIGGDEFAVIFHEPDGPRDPASKPPASISDIAMRFQKQVCEHRFPKLAEQAPGTITISGGLATYPWDGRTAEELLEKADRLSLESKRQGKNVITLGPGAERTCDADTGLPDQPAPQ
jgi:diguanylate cyclase (GGDEF)-like protein